jgi:CheY-like chemotaxis protein
MREALGHPGGPPIHPIQDSPKGICTSSRWAPPASVVDVAAVLQPHRLDTAARRILVVDDDPDIRAALEDALSVSGYLVAAARNGSEALQALRSMRCDLVLLDLMMPVMTGWEFRDEQLRDPVLAGIPVIVISAARSPAPIDAAAYLPKPFDLDRLLELVDRLAGQQIAKAGRSRNGVQAASR